MSPKVCQCHGVVMRRYPRHWYCAILARASERIRSRRYRRTANGRDHMDRNNARRVRIGRRTVARMDTPAQAAIINAHIARQITAFTAQQKETDAALT